MRGPRTIERLEGHPNLAEVLGVLAQLPLVGDTELARLAQTWHDNVLVARARELALSPDSPLVVEVLRAFQTVTALFEDDLQGEPWTQVDPEVAVVGVKAVRDAVAAAYARPVLTRTQHEALRAPWRAVFPHAQTAEPDLGPRGREVRALLASLPRLGQRCHDGAGRRLWEGLVDASFVEEADRDEAREQAFGAAVLLGRRRLWALVRASGTDALERPCPVCRRHAAGPFDGPETERVAAVVLDAACALLVADAVSDNCLRRLTAPVTALVPAGG